MRTSTSANGVTHLLIDHEACLEQLLLPMFPQYPELLRLGAVYVNRVRTTQSPRVAPGDYVRVHPHPRRFQSSQIEWNKTLLHETDDYLAIHKPAGIPVHATIDNTIENVLAEWKKLRETWLGVTHRLDTATSGILILAKTQPFQRQFNDHLRRKKVQKTYLALSAFPVPSGIWTHSMKQSPYAPHSLTHPPEPNELFCETWVDESEATPLGYQTRLSPLTGRTHQLRAQMAYYGSPILGDTLYGGEERAQFHADRIGLHAQVLAFYSLHGKPQEIVCEPDWTTNRLAAEERHPRR